MKLTSQQTDRAVGALVGGAVGDALGVPYEYNARTMDEQPQMHGGGLGGYAPGQWSDDTEMSVCIAQVAATGADLRTTDALDRIAQRFLEWYEQGPADIGMQTGRVLSQAARRGGGAEGMAQVSAELHQESGRTAGNGSLMRTAPVALAHLDDIDALAEVARAVSALTHHDPRAGEACVLWCLAIRQAVLTGQLDIRSGLSHVDADYWSPLLDEAETVTPAHYGHSNGWAVAALLGAWSAVSSSSSYEEGIVRAVHGGGDTDTVAAIAGALLGARYGGSAVPARWRRRVHGWPGLRARDLVRLAVLTTRAGRTTGSGWPTCERMADGYGASDAVALHPDDPGVLLGSIGALEALTADAVVSLCRLGTSEAPLTKDPADHIEFWLIDEEDRNLDPSAVVLDAARTVRELRSEGKSVLVHCVHCHSRTPNVAAAYGSLLTGRPLRDSLQRVLKVLPEPAYPRRSLVQDLHDRDPSSW